MSREADREAIKEGKPFIRSVVAFLVYLRGGRGLRMTNGFLCDMPAPTIYEAYVAADDFLSVLAADLKTDEK